MSLAFSCPDVPLIGLHYTLEQEAGYGVAGVTGSAILGHGSVYRTRFWTR